MTHQPAGTLFGLDAAEVRESIARVEPTGTGDKSGAAERFARAAWSGITEPGDSVAGFLVSAVGASAALTMLVDHWSVERMTAELAPVGDHEALGTIVAHENLHALGAE